MMWDGWSGGYGGGWWLFGLMHLLWWLLLIAGGVALVRLLLRPRSEHDSARQILRERYARGEIDKVEFDERMRHLQ
jgi:putative membrane protein